MGRPGPAPMTTVMAAQVIDVAELAEDDDAGTDPPG